MTKNLQQLITFYETLNKSKKLLLNKLTPEANADSSTPLELRLENNVTMISKDNALIVTHRVLRTADPDEGSLTWRATFNAGEINLEYVRTEWGSGYPSVDYVDTYAFVIKNGSIVTANHVDKSFSDFGDSHVYEYSLSEASQQEMLEKLEGLIVSSTPMVEAAMAEYEFKIKATPIVHGFFKSVKTNTMPSTTEDVENIILNYLA